MFAVVAALCFVVAAVVGDYYLSLALRYRRAVASLEDRQWDTARQGFAALADYRDASDMLVETSYREAMRAMEDEEWEKAREALQYIPVHPEADSLLLESYYRPAVQALKAEEWDMAREALQRIPSYLDADTLLNESYYQLAVQALEAEEWNLAREALQRIPSYLDADTLLNESYYRPAVQALEAERWEEAREALQHIRSYRDADTLLKESYYRPAVQVFEAGEWDKARAELEALIGLDAEYKDAQTLLRESYYQLAVEAVGAEEWDKARAGLVGLIRLDAQYKDAAELWIKALFQGRSERKMHFELQAPEENVFSPNTRMELQSIEFFPDGRIRLNLSIAVESGNSAIVLQPDKVYLDVSGMSILASDFGGVFGEGSRIEKLKMGGEGTVGYGWIEFAEALSAVASAECFEFHYGKYYNFASVCISPVSPTPDAGPTPEAQLFSVEANKSWQNTGVRVNPRDYLEIVYVSGKWRLDPTWDYVGPEGYPTATNWSAVPLRSAVGGSLVGRVGEEGGVFLVGTAISFRSTQTGMLQLRMNDSDTYNNDGSIIVSIFVR